jgi:hypothetical protein
MPSRPRPPPPRRAGPAVKLTKNGQTPFSRPPFSLPLKKIKNKRNSGENGPNFLGFFILGLIGLGILILLQSIIK